MRKLIGEILTEHGVAAAPVVEEAFRKQGEGDTRRIGEILCASGAVTVDQVGFALAEQAGFPLTEKDLVARQETTLLARFPIFLARRFRALPLFTERDHLLVALADPDDLVLLNQLYLLYGLTVVPVMLEEKRVTELINNAYSRLDTAEGTLNEEEFRDMADEEGGALPDLIDSNDEAPIIRFVNAMVANAACRRRAARPTT